MKRKTIYAPPGKYMIIGRRDDTDDIVFTVIDDVSERPTLTELCRKALYHMGINDPMVYEFLCMMYSPGKGGSQAILDQAALRRYVHANYW